MIHFIVLGEPKPQKRHRSTRVGPYLRNYDPSADEKEDFLWMAHQHAPATPLTCGIQVVLELYFPRPKSHFNSKGLLKENAPVYKTSKPDIDNLIKFVLDALNHIYYKDDGQVYATIVHKYYTLNPRTEVFINPLE